MRFAVEIDRHLAADVDFEGRYLTVVDKRIVRIREVLELLDHQHVNSDIHRFIGESRGVAALPGAPHLEWLTLLSNLIDGGPHWRVGRPFAVEYDSDLLHVSSPESDGRIVR
jgi:hypothetical protein